MNPVVLLNRQWWKTTLLAVAAIAVMVRLGIWQLDRLEQRREFNARVQSQLDQPKLDLSGNKLGADLENMEYRTVVVRGVYLHSYQVVLRNQAWESQLGVHLITPLHITGSDQFVLVDRGWIPFEDFSNGNMQQYDEPGAVAVGGMIRRSEITAEIGGKTDRLPGPGEEPLMAWNLVNVEGIAAQTPYSFVPVYVQQAPEPGRTSLPYRELPVLELTEGPHLGYAIQWFIFATILAIGYPLYVRRNEYAYKEAAKIRSIRPGATKPNHNHPDDRINHGHT
jgi:surfeit locus 1 family protein